MMKKGMMNVAVAGAMIFTAGSVALATGEGWTDNFEQAKQQATKEGKDILMDFTGSDWCGWCIKLDNEVFKQDAFKASAPKDFVLVVLDYPRDKTRVSEETAKQNEALKAEFAIRGYPTLFLTDAAGRPYAKASYQAGGPENYLTYLAGLKAKGAERNRAFAAAKAEEDPLAKSKLLDAALEALDPELISRFYTPEIEQIIALDAENAAGLKAKYGLMLLDEKLKGLLQEGKADEAAALIEETLAQLPLENLAEVQAEYAKKLSADRMRMLMRAKKYNEVVALLEERIAKEKPEGEALMEMELSIARTYAVMRETEKSLKMTDGIIARNNLKGAALQDALLVKYNAYWHIGDKPSQTRTMKEIVAADPDGDRSKAIQKGLDEQKAKEAAAQE